MARKTPVPEQEIAICRRLLQAREAAMLTRAAVAQMIDISPERVAEYERGRVPLPYSIGAMLCDALSINQQWLAEGLKPTGPAFRMHRSIMPETKGHELFSTVYFSKLKALCDEEWEFISSVVKQPREEISPKDQTVRMWPALGSPEVEKIAVFVSRIACLKALMLSDADAMRFAIAVKELARTFPATCIESEKSGVDTLRESVNSVSVTDEPKKPQPTWDEVIERTKLATAAKGSKGLLAEDLGIDQSRLSEWLSGRVEPGASVAFRLLRLVEKLEGANKKPRVLQHPRQKRPRKVTSMKTKTVRGRANHRPAKSEKQSRARGAELKGQLISRLIGPELTAEAIAAAEKEGRTLGQFVSEAIRHRGQPSWADQAFIPGNELPWHNLSFVNGNNAADVMVPAWLRDLFIANTGWKCVQNGGAVIVDRRDLPAPSDAETAELWKIIKSNEGKDKNVSFDLEASVQSIAIFMDLLTTRLGDLMGNYLRDGTRLTCGVITLESYLSERLFRAYDATLDELARLDLQLAACHRMLRLNTGVSGTGLLNELLDKAKCRAEIRDYPKAEVAA